MRRIDSDSLTLKKKPGLDARAQRRKNFAEKKSWGIFCDPASLREASFDFFMGIATPYEDEEILVDDDIGSRIDAPWKVILYNDDIHTFEEVIVQLQKALGCGQSRAEKIAFEAHSRGKAIAYDGEFEDCFRVLGVLREIQLVVEIEG